MLYEFKNYNKHGNIRTRIISGPKGRAFGINPKNLGSFIGVKIFKYDYTHPFHPPGLATIGNQKYITPTWKPVREETELSDINWIKPKPKVVKKQKTIVVETLSSKGDKTYTTRFYPDTKKFSCTCPGTWMSNNNCKHIKKLRNEQR